MDIWPGLELKPELVWPLARLVPRPRISTAAAEVSVPSFPSFPAPFLSGWLVGDSAPQGPSGDGGASGASVADNAFVINVGQIILYCTNLYDFKL